MFTSTAVCLCVCVCVACCSIPHVQDQIPERLSALLGCAFQAGLDKIWWCGSVSHGLAYIFIFLSFNKLFRVAVVAGKGCSLAWTVLEFFLILLVVFGAAWMRFSSV